MPRGGPRHGAGRKPGSRTVKTRVKEAIVKAGLDPLEVMLHAMRAHAKADRWDKAAAIARDAAPYCHSRQAALAIRSEVEIETRHVIELIITTREQADEALAALSATSGVPRQ